MHNYVPIRNTPSKGEKEPLLNISTRINTSSQQTLDDLVLQCKKLDKINVVPPTIVKKTTTTSTTRQR